MLSPKTLRWPKEDETFLMKIMLLFSLHLLKLPPNWFTEALHVHLRSSFLRYIYGRFHFIYHHRFCFPAHHIFYIACFISLRFPFLKTNFILVYSLTAAALISNFVWWLLPLQISFWLLWTSQTSFSHSMLQLWPFSYNCLLRFHTNFLSFITLPTSTTYII